MADQTRPKAYSSNLRQSKHLKGRFEEVCPLFSGWWEAKKSKRNVETISPILRGEREIWIPFLSRASKPVSVQWPKAVSTQAGTKSESKNLAESPKIWYWTMNMSTCRHIDIFKKGDSLFSDRRLLYPPFANIWFPILLVLGLYCLLDGQNLQISVYFVFLISHNLALLLFLSLIHISEPTRPY